MRKSKLWEQVDRILWEDWDPIGINYSGHENEYSGYVPSVIKLLKQDADVQKIAELLLEHANITMGVPTSLEEHLMVAKKIKQLTS
ncbi:hypothetical protein [Maribacter ulvicola]|uniref:DUF1871 domain-containing protein n=1 Tax=Maribacter ulvicola TaxID=228959 RepID=A0A1N6PSZ8_9FLAO|nr:hypothetical protein [Maribacter ulvicola]SIQ07478.1 hypothetical protein SAMN05421797_101584 [Maribacter ulvicola]